MLLNWITLWEELNARSRGGRGAPLADPLEGAEWRGLLWAVPVLAALTAGHGGRQAKTDGARPTDRCTSVSDSSRSSAG